METKNEVLDRVLKEVQKVLEEYKPQLEQEVSTNRKADNRYVYDNIRPSIEAEPDRNVWIKKEEIQLVIQDLIKAQEQSSPDEAINHINDPDTITKTPKKDEYGLTDEQSKILLEYIFCVEGGYFNHPNDPGGETMYGIIKQEARNWGYTGEMKNLPKEVAVEIYKRKYWKANGLKNINNFAKALTIFDFFVNSGNRGAKIAQKTVNRLYAERKIIKSFEESMKDVRPLAEDGMLGPKSFEAINNTPTLAFLLGYTLFQEDQYEDLMRNNSKLRTFDEGWENRILKKSIYINEIITKGIVEI